jgi:Bacterial Ig-like domain/PQQ-like domain
MSSRTFRGVGVSIAGGTGTKAMAFLAVVALGLGLCANAQVPEQLVWSRYFGGYGWEEASGFGLDAEGNCYVSGRTRSMGFPTTPGAYQETYIGGGSLGDDGFLAKVNSEDGSLMYSTLLGGTGDDRVSALLVESTGEVYVVGRTTSGDFPITPGAYVTPHRGGYDVFVAKFNAAGDTLLFSAILGGSAEEALADHIVLAKDASGALWIGGATASTDFPKTGDAFDDIFAGPSEGFLVRLSADGSTYEYASFLGGSGDDSIFGVALDSFGEIYLCGLTSSWDFPTLNGYDHTYNGGDDYFVSRLDGSGTALLYSTFLGGSGRDAYPNMVVAATGLIYLTGWTESWDFPTTSGAYDPTFNGNREGLCVLLDMNEFATNGLLASTYLGTSAHDYTRAIALDPDGDVWLCGETASSGFPTTPYAYDTTLGGSNDLVIVEFNSTLSQMLYSTFVGGSASEYHDQFLGIDAVGAFYVWARTDSEDYPANNTYSGGIDGVLTKIDPLHAGLADSAWPMLGKDQQHSGYTDRLGPLTEPWILWEAVPGIEHGYCWITPTLDEDANIYLTVGQGSPVPSANRVEYSFSYDPFGSLRWTFGPVPNAVGLSVPALTADNKVALAYRLGYVAYHTQSAGDLLWATWVGSKNFSSPVIDDNGYIYIGGRQDRNGIYKVSPSNGSIMWSNIHDWGVTNAPALSQDQATVYYSLQLEGAGPVASVIAVDSLTGVEKYEFSLPEDANWGWVSPTVGPDGTIYIQHATTGVLYALTDTGSSMDVKWTFDPVVEDPNANTGGAVRIVAVDVDTVYVSSWVPDPILFALDFNGAKKWQTTFSGDDHVLSELIATYEAVYASLDGSGQVVCMDRNTGETLWTKQVGEPGASINGPVLGDGSIIYVTTEGTAANPGVPATLVALRPNNPPVADAGPDQVFEVIGLEGKSVSLDGSGSTDADSTSGTNDDIVQFEWILDSDVIATGESASAALSHGVNVVTLRVTDSRGETDEDEVQITVRDTTPPTFLFNTTAPEPTGVAPIPVMVRFSEAIVDFTVADIVPTNATVGSFVMSTPGLVYTFALTPTAQNVLVEARIPAGAVTDLAGNPNAAGPAFRRTYQPAPPPPVVTSFTQVFPANTIGTDYILRFRVTYSQQVYYVDAGDFDVFTHGAVPDLGVLSVQHTGSSTYLTVKTRPFPAYPIDDGSLQVYLVDNDSIINRDGIPLGGPGRQDASSSVYVVRP